VHRTPKPRLPAPPPAGPQCGASARVVVGRQPPPQALGGG